MGSNKGTLILIALLLIGIAVAYPIFKNSQASDSVLGESGVGVVTGTLLAKVQSVRLDTSILNDRNFTSLTDWTLPPLNLPVGKRNPFSGGF